MNKPNNPPAFPMWDKDDTVFERPIRQPGMTLRDYFAAKAMHGFASRLMDTGSGYDFEIMSEESYQIADAMLAEREKDTPNSL